MFNKKGPEIINFGALLYIPVVILNLFLLILRTVIYSLCITNVLNLHVFVCNENCQMPTCTGKDTKKSCQ